MREYMYSVTHVVVFQQLRIDVFNSPTEAELHCTYRYSTKGEPNQVRVYIYHENKQRRL